MTGTIVARPLATLRAADAPAVGRKAALLGELLAAGFPVPAGYVLPAAALDSTVDGPPDGAAAAVAEIAAALGGPVAVRSSAAAEDLAGASYAGQYESVLDVPAGADPIAAAVRRCLASASAERVTRYAAAAGPAGAAAAAGAAGAGGMSVLVQRMVPADAAGVAFTANPVTGDRGEVVINAVRGLGERLVSGAATGEGWSVRGGVPRRVSGTERAIDAAEAAAVADLARRVERHFGEPQDIEWAFAAGTLWLLQARPVTALPDPPADEPADEPVQVPPGVWARSTYAPEPLSPMFGSMMLPGLRALTENLFPYSLGERIEFCVLGGWLYSQFVRATDPARIREKLQGAIAAVARDEPMDVFRDWFGTVEPALTARLDRMRDDVDLPELTDDELLSHVDDALDAWQLAVGRHFRIGGSGTFVLGELGVTCRDLLGWDAPETLALLLGLQGKTTEPAYRLAELADLARRRPAVRQVLDAAAVSGTDTSAEHAVARLSEVDPEFAAGLADYQRRYGHRTLGMDIVEPTVAERPALVLSLIRGQLQRDFDPVAATAALTGERAAAQAAGRQQLADRPADLARFEQAVARAQHASPGRDDSHYLSQVAAGLLRRAVREIGGRLVRRGAVRGTDDVFLLEHAEAVAALRSPTDRGALVERRRVAREKARANPGPDGYGTAAAGGPPAGLLAALPPPARHIMEVGLWAWKEVSGERAHQPGGPGGDAAAAGPAGDGVVLTGIAGSRGRYTGPVRVIRTEGEFGKLRPGDVLVCPETNPQWAVLFPSVGALVTDHGGLLSHPAIIAREYRVPAVLATGTGTAQLRDGQLVTVDGTAGTVQLSPA